MVRHGGPNNPQVDRIPLEGIVGWDTTLNGNLAQLLQEPTLMGAYEGAGITVLGKGRALSGSGAAESGHRPSVPRDERIRCRIRYRGERQHRA